MAQSSNSNSSCSGSSCSAINRFFAGLGVPIVPDRSLCSLTPCGITVRCGGGQASTRKRPLATLPDGAADAEAAGAGAGKCAVCQDAATGCHYGAAACDCCKEFFERTVRCRLIHDCHFRRGCDLRLNRRNHCQGCRWDRCLEAGMEPSAVKKRLRSAGTGITWDLGRREQPSRSPWSPHSADSPQSTLQPSLPSPTDTDDSSRDTAVASVESEDEEVRTKPPAELPITAELVRAALTPVTLDSAPARLADLERACLVELFRWNKRRLVGYSDLGFGAAAANWMPILVATAARHFLARRGLRRRSADDAGSFIGAELRLRLGQLRRGFGEGALAAPLMDAVTDGIASLCRELLGGSDCLGRDALADIILMMGDLVEDELLASLQSPSTSPAASTSARQLRVARSLFAVTQLLRSAGAEQRALLLAALVADGPDQPGLAIDSSHTTDRDEAGIRMPALIGL